MTMLRRPSLLLLILTLAVAGLETGSSLISIGTLDFGTAAEAKSVALQLR